MREYKACSRKIQKGNRAGLKLTQVINSMPRKELSQLVFFVCGHSDDAPAGIYVQRPSSSKF